MTSFDEITIAATHHLRAARHYPRDNLAAKDVGRIYRVCWGLWLFTEVYADPDLEDAMACRAHSSVIGYPSLLPNQLLPVRVYRQPLEYAVSDKIHAAVQHGRENSRMRDYYDLFVVCTRAELDDDKIRRAILASWPLYGREGLPPAIEDIVAFTDVFAAKNAGVWDQLRGQARYAVEIPDLQQVCETIRKRLGPILADINNPQWGIAA